MRVIASAERGPHPGEGVSDESGRVDARVVIKDVAGDFVEDLLAPPDVVCVEAARVSSRSRREGGYSTGVEDDDHPGRRVRSAVRDASGAVALGDGVDGGEALRSAGLVRQHVRSAQPAMAANAVGGQLALVDQSRHVGTRDP